MRFALSGATLLVLVVATVAMMSERFGHSSPALAADVDGQPDGISMEIMSKFHIQLNEVCHSFKVGMGYCGPLARSGRSLVMVQGRKDIYRWTIHDGWDDGRNLATEIFQLRLARQKPRDFEFGTFTEGTTTYYIVLEAESDPDVPLKQLRGKTPREFLKAVQVKADSKADE